MKEEAVYGCMTSSPLGTSRKAKDEGVYVGQWIEVVESMEFSSGCFSVPSKVESKIIKLVRMKQEAVDSEERASRS